eukprot:Plantae.Rhodophyta-Rhodochaete_pulchella.ctg5192.p1 GENE.Plantae.Rhodophyta-Rhodochaete_pulchella.ctg5192~~Plantae.Rhodophyta-Rhodochaete_pulchella.ctg5192.p1  ORF type:complete len:460 (+),score=64.91 Plantae.Rhodophyta-Rhodochaete_pulchella.ctg5192:927-2306(+)
MALFTYTTFLLLVVVIVVLCSQNVEAGKNKGPGKGNSKGAGKANSKGAGKANSKGAGKGIGKGIGKSIGKVGQKVGQKVGNKGGNKSGPNKAQPTTKPICPPNTGCQKNGGPGACWNSVATLQTQYGPWDSTDYSSIVPGSKSSGEFCGDLDVCFALDESGSMTSVNFKKEIEFVRRLVATLVERLHKDHPGEYAAWLFDQDSEGINDEVEPLTPRYDSLLTALNGVYYNGGCTNVSAGLHNCRTELTLRRPDRTKVMFLLSDGLQTVDTGNGIFVQTEEDAEVIKSAQAMKDMGIHLFVIGMHEGTACNPSLREFLKKLASKVNGKELYFELSFTAIGSIGDQITENLANTVCDSNVVPKKNETDPESTCGCSIYNAASPGACVEELLSQDVGGKTGSCLYRGCENLRWACDVLNPTDTCELIRENAWVCDPAGIVDATHCDCIYTERTRVAHLRELA